MWASKHTAETGVWHEACINFAHNSEQSTITFQAVRGSEMFGDIAVDNVEMVDFCPRKEQNI